jgi:2,4-dienoyl-CoA reductase-like NADH-dependent reductase (Old Yellow Enzyme family)
MTEALAPPHGNPTELLFTLYKKWTHSGAAVIQVGNIMVHRDHLERAGNVIFDDKTDLESVRIWASHAKSTGNKCIVQISHPGRQANPIIQSQPVSPSDVEFSALGLTIKPRALTLDEISDVVDRFNRAAKISVDSGFDGIQIHSAHGYLISQFLSPRTNKRTDQYGGSLENRARLLLQIIETTRKTMGSEKILSVKLNSSDFSRGGFSHEDSLKVVKMIHNQGLVDIIEVSGGNYESLVILGDQEIIANSTKEREGYFRTFAADAIRVLNEGDSTTRPLLMLTGGMRTMDTIESVLANNEADLVGIARPLAFEPTLVQDMLDGHISGAIYVPFSPLSFFKNYLKSLVAMGETAWYGEQMNNLARGRNPDPDISVTAAVLRSLANDCYHMLWRKIFD